MSSSSATPAMIPLTRSVGALVAPSTADVRTLRVVKSFDDYYRSDYRKLVGLAYVMTGSHVAAEDLAQDALTEAHRKWAKISTYDDPAGWVRRVMINKSTSRLRRVRTEAKGLVQIAARRAETLVPTERSLEVWEAVRRLPTRQAQVIALFYWEDRSIADISEILDLSPETTKTHLKRARSTLAIGLDAHREGLL